MTGQLRAQRIAIDDADRRLAEADHELNRIENAVSVGFSLVSTLLLTATLLTVATLTKQGIIGAPAAAFGLLIAFAATEPFAALRRGALELGRTLLAAKRIAPRLATQNLTSEIGQPPGLCIPVEGCQRVLRERTASGRGEPFPVTSCRRAACACRRQRRRKIHDIGSARR